MIQSKIVLCFLPQFILSFLTVLLCFPNWTTGWNNQSMWTHSCDYFCCCWQTIWYSIWRGFQKNLLCGKMRQISVVKWHRWSQDLFVFLLFWFGLFLIFWLIIIFTDFARGSLYKLGSAEIEGFGFPNDFKSKSNQKNT